MRAESINFLSNAAIFSSMLLLPLFAEDLGASPSIIGLIVASFAMSTFISNYIFGRLADVHGRRLFLRVGVALSAVACAVQYFAYDPLSLLLVRILLGFCAGIYPAALLAYAYESKRRMNRFLAWGSGGWGLGTVGAGIIGTYFAIETPFLFSALLFLLSVPVAFTMPFAKEVRLSVPLFPVKVMKRNLAVYLAVLVRHTGACSIWVMYPMFIRTLGGTGQNLFFWIGLMYAINSVTQFLVMRSLRRRSTVLIPAGLGLSAVTFLLFTLCGTVWELMPTQVLLAIAWALIYVGSVKFIMARSVERATATGVLNSTLQMSSITGSLIGGALIQATGDNYLAPMYLATIMAIISLVIYYIILRHERAKRA